MKDGICPKCKAEKVHITRANRTPINVPFNSGWSAGAQANFLVCCECGFAEIYVKKRRFSPFEQRLGKSSGQKMIYEFNNLSG